MRTLTLYQRSRSPGRHLYPSVGSRRRPSLYSNVAALRASLVGYVQRSQDAAPRRVVSFPRSRVWGGGLGRADGRLACSAARPASRLRVGVFYVPPYDGGFTAASRYAATPADARDQGRNRRA